MTDTIFEAVRISKQFAGVSALSNVSLKMRSGEVLCLLGDNGAGKSTLIKIMCGVFQPSSGHLRLDGKSIIFRRPSDARAEGIAAVQQFGGTVPLMNIVRNFFLGAEITRGRGLFRRMDMQRATDLALDHLKQLGLTRLNDGTRLVGALSGGERQALTIAKAAYFGARLLILDEPTSALGVKEASIVLRLIKQAAAKGIAIVFITHNAQHALSVGDHFTVLNRGVIADDFRRGERTKSELINLMAGGDDMEKMESELGTDQAT